MKKPTSQPDTAGIILAGGASSRFGSNKALAEFRGQPLIEHAANIFNHLFQERLLVTNTASEYEFLNWPMVSDIFNASGPLAGIHSGLKNITCAQAFVTACDMPLLDTRLIEFLCRLPGSWDAAVPWLDNGPEPLYAVYRKSCLSAIEKNLAGGQLKISRMLTDIKVRRVKFLELQPLISNFTTFHNINRPDDLKALSKLPSLAQARKNITTRLQGMPGQILPISAGLGRVAKQHLRTDQPVPHFIPSRMDGFAVRAEDLGQPESLVNLKITSEIPAGCTDIPAIARGEAARIMTGGHLPVGGSLVIPLEKCREDAGYVQVKAGIPRKNYIKKIGGDIRAGQIIVKKGTKITPSHLHRLAAGGSGEISVYKKVKVAILCTGSELVESDPRPGQTISANRILLDALNRQTGTIPLDLGLIKDRQEEIHAALNKAFKASIQMIITTGGMGPGKFDLVKNGLEDVGVSVVWQGVNVRPGSTTLFGLKDNIAIFALPGSPPAVQTLFYEFVRPALWKLQGLKSPVEQLLKAELETEILINRRGVLNLKGGRLAWKSGRFTVSPVGRGGNVNSIIHIPANRRLVCRGEKVTVMPFYGIVD